MLTGPKCICNFLSTRIVITI